MPCDGPVEDVSHPFLSPKDGRDLIQQLQGDPSEFMRLESDLVYQKKKTSRHYHSPFLSHLFEK